MEAETERGHMFLLACLSQKAQKYSLARPAWEKYLATRCGGGARRAGGVSLSAVLKFENDASGILVYSILILHAVYLIKELDHSATW